MHLRHWATTVPRDYPVEGFVLDDARLKDARSADYFDELHERIRDIRATEKRFSMRVRDAFATSADWDSGTDTARTFFATVQDEMLHAVTGHTAAELVTKRCDPGAPNLGLTGWAGSRVRKNDAGAAKNCRLTTRFLTFAQPDVLAGAGSVSNDAAKETVVEGYPEFDDRRHAEETVEEENDLRALLEIEREGPPS